MSSATPGLVRGGIGRKRHRCREGFVESEQRYREKGGKSSLLFKLRTL